MFQKTSQKISRKSRTLLQKSILVVAGLAISLGAYSTADAHCSTCVTPTVAYRPVAYQANYSGYTGWYPGYWLSRLFSPSTYYSASYAPSYYTASYAPRYTAAYAPTYSVGYAPTYQTVARPIALSSYYAPSSCTTCNYGCGTGCGTQQVTLRPACCGTGPTSGCSACGHSPCSCSASHVAPAVYASPPPSPCSSCVTGAAYTPGTYPSPRVPASPPGMTAPLSPSTPRTFSQESQPSLEPQSNVAPERTAIPSSSEGSATRSSNYFEAPTLFNPRDRVTQRRSTPIWNAVYQKQVVAKQVAYRTVDRATVSRAQAERDAAGWNSVD